MTLPANTGEIIGKFAQLFEGRIDVYGASGDDAPGCVKEPVTIETYAEHLYKLGRVHIGIYPITPRNTVWWGCADIDDGDLDAAKGLRTALAAMGVKAWIEVSRSKGYHVWVFAEHETPAVIMRRVFLVAYQAIGLQVKEINPKQEELTADQVGNYVRLPYMRGLAVDMPARQIVLDDELEPMRLHEFVEAAFYFRTEAKVLRKWAALWSPPRKALPTQGYTPSGDTATLASRLPGLAFKVFTEGPREGMDRSNTLVKFAHLCFESGAFTRSEMYTLLADGDRRWGKFSERTDCEQQLTRIIEGAWS